ncbi:MAG: RsmG family class I SAM-dependent methyltransferase [Acidobacteriota bacterium]
MSAQLRMLLADYGVPPESTGGRGFLTHLELLSRWQPRVNLVGSLSWSNLGPLYEEALWAARLYPPSPTLHLDAGSGAGFPALLLRLLLPRMNLDLVESRTRRAAFLEHVSGVLGLSQVRVHNRRLDELLRARPLQARPWDCVSWKAVRLSRTDMTLVLDASAAEARFWMFHGARLPLERAEEAEERLDLVLEQPHPSKSGWRLSIFQKRPS